LDVRIRVDFEFLEAVVAAEEVRDALVFVLGLGVLPNGHPAHWVLESGGFGLGVGIHVGLSRMVVYGPKIDARMITGCPRQVQRATGI
jgi:hypothetical protein